MPCLPCLPEGPMMPCDPFFPFSPCGPRLPLGPLLPFFPGGPGTQTFPEGWHKDPGSRLLMRLVISRRSSSMVSELLLDKVRLRRNFVFSSFLLKSSCEKQNKSKQEMKTRRFFLLPVKDQQVKLQVHWTFLPFRFPPRFSSREIKGPSNFLPWNKCRLLLKRLRYLTFKHIYEEWLKWSSLSEVKPHLPG